LLAASAAAREALAVSTAPFLSPCFA